MDYKKYYTEQQLSTLMLHLAKGECPVKYLYLNPIGAQSRSNIENHNTTYKDSEIAVEMIVPYLSELGDPEELVIFDFGCGNGSSILPVIKKIQSLNRKIHYHAFDISPIILDFCKKTITDHTSGVSFDSSIVDFEATNLINILYEVRKNYGNIPVLGTFLGNTMGNFGSLHRVLSNIMDAMRISDRLAIGIQKSHLSNPRRIEKVVKSYEEPIIKKISLSTLKTLGIPKESGQYYAEFDQNNNVNAYFEFVQPTTIDVLPDQKISFDSGEKVRVLKSTKLNESLLSQIFDDLNYRVVSIKSSRDDSYIQACIANKML